MNQNRIDLYLKYKSNRFKSPQLLLTRPGFSEIINETHVEFFLPTGVHTFELTLLNKLSNDTVLEDGKIIDDLYVVIEDLKINNISFANNLDQIASYTDWNGNIVSTNGWLSYPYPRPYIITVQTPGYFFARNLSLLSADWQKNYNPALFDN